MPVGTIPEELFVGRAEELEHLEEALRLTAEKHGRMDALVGEPGIGKSRLAEELCERARARGVRVLTGRCVEDTGTPPYWPWTQAIEPYLESLTPKDLTATLGGSAPLLAMVFPVINRLLPGLKPFGVVTQNPEELRFRLLDAVASLLVRITADRPLLILLDDLHWADEGTPKLLVAVARELGQSHLMILGTYRDVELDRKHPLARVLGELARERQFERHVLGGLSENEVRAYCAGALPGNGSTELPRAVHAMTEGNPLFVVEVVRELAHQGVEKLDGALPRLPEGVREIIGRRLDRLSETCNGVLGVAAVMGIEFGQPELTRAVQDTSEAEVLGAIGEASHARVLEDVPGIVGRHRFTHALVRETLRAELSLRERVRVHARVATVLEEAYGEEAPAHATELVGHFESAEPILGPDKLAHYALLAAEQALASYAYEDALSFSRRGLAALKGRSMDDLQAELCCAKAEALCGTSSFPEAPASYRKAFDHYRATGNVEKAVGIAVLNSRIGQPGVLDLCRDALPLVPEDSLEAGRILARIGGCLAYGSNEDAEGVRILQKALAIAQEHEDPVLELQALSSWAEIDWFYHRLDGMATKQRRILELAASAGNPLAEFWSHSFLSDAAGREGRLEEARAHLRAMYRLCERLGEHWLMRYPLYNDAASAAHVGDWERARRFTTLALRASPDWYRPLCNAVDIEYQTGNTTEGRQYLDRVIDLARRQERSASQEVAAAVAAVGKAAYLGGDVSSAQVARSLAQALLADSPNPTIDGWMRTGLGYLAALERDPTESRVQYEGELAARGPAADYFDADILGLLARTYGDFPKALSHFRYAHDHFAHERPRYAWVCYELGQTLVEASGAAAQEARALWQEALGIARELGMLPLEERVTRALADLAPERLPAGLTDREAQVLRLLAAGKTNKEIAFELHISEKTVINHVTHVYAKTGAGNRVEAAAFATKHGLAEA